MATGRLGIIGGSGLYDLPDLEQVQTLDLKTPYGRPSDPLRLGRLGQTEVVFLARHGRGHHHTPTELPYRANIYALKEAGVTHVVSLSAVGSLRGSIAPLSLVIPDQIIDRTVDRPRTFFGEGVVAHVGLAEPFCPILRARLGEACQATGRDVHNGGTYVCIEGPQFSTKAESELYRSWGASVIGMTAMPEARLAREAELCYGMVALVTDYDVWHEANGPVTVEMVVANLAKNAEAGRSIVRAVAAAGLPSTTCDCQHALRDAIITAPDAIPSTARERLGLIVDDYLPAAESEP